MSARSLSESVPACPQRSSTSFQFALQAYAQTNPALSLVPETAFRDAVGLNEKEAFIPSIQKATGAGPAEGVDLLDFGFCLASHVLNAVVRRDPMTTSSNREVGSGPLIIASDGEAGISYGRLSRCCIAGTSANWTAPSKPNCPSRSTRGVTDKKDRAIKENTQEAGDSDVPKSSHDTEELESGGKHPSESGKRGSHVSSGAPGSQGEGACSAVAGALRGGTRTSQAEWGNADQHSSETPAEENAGCDSSRTDAEFTAPRQDIGRSGERASVLQGKPIPVSGVAQAPVFQDLGPKTTADKAKGSSNGSRENALIPTDARDFSAVRFDDGTTLVAGPLVSSAPEDLAFSLMVRATTPTDSKSPAAPWLGASSWNGLGVIQIQQAEVVPAATGGTPTVSAAPAPAKPEGQGLCESDSLTSLYPAGSARGGASPQAVLDVSLASSVSMSGQHGPSNFDSGGKAPNKETSARRQPQQLFQHTELSTSSDTGFTSGAVRKIGFVLNRGQTLVRLSLIETAEGINVRVNSPNETIRLQLRDAVPQILTSLGKSGFEAKTSSGSQRSHQTLLSFPSSPEYGDTGDGEGETNQRERERDLANDLQVDFEDR
jgi:hypothetical protein